MGGNPPWNFLSPASHSPEAKLAQHAFFILPYQKLCFLIFCSWLRIFFMIKMRHRFLMLLSNGKLEAGYLRIFFKCTGRKMRAQNMIVV